MHNITTAVHQVGNASPSSVQNGLRAIDRLSEVCKKLYSISERAQNAANAINGSQPEQSDDDKSPAVTISSLCDSLDSLAQRLATQVDRISVGLGC